MVFKPTDPSSLVGRVTPCAPPPASNLPNGAHGVTRPTGPRGSAFTLPELLVSVALGTLLLLGGSSFYLFSISSFASMTNYSELNSQSRAASDFISRDIRSAIFVAGYTTNQ